MNLIYGIKDKPKFGQMLVFALQQVLAILAATILVPAIIGNGMSQAAALFGAGVGTIVYQMFTKFRSPVFLGSSFAFLGSMGAAFAGAVSTAAGFAGLLLGAVFAGLVYVVIAIVVKVVGVKWINKLMPPVVIGPTVALIGLSLAVNAVNDLKVGKVMVDGVSAASPYVAILTGIITLLAIFCFSVYGKKMAKLIPFVLGILVGYIVASIFTVIGIATDNVSLQLINFAAFKEMEIFAVPAFSFVEALKGVKEVDGSYIATIAVAYVPVAFVVFAEHIADHKNLSTIIGHVSAKTTLNIYTHITSDMEENAAVNIDRGIAKTEIKKNPEAESANTPQRFEAQKAPRRRPGTGYVKQIKDNLWEGRYSPIYPDGKRYPRNVYAHSEEECEALLKEVIREVNTELAEARKQATAS